MSDEWKARVESIMIALWLGIVTTHAITLLRSSMRFLLLVLLAVSPAFAIEANGPTYGGKEVRVWMPADQHLRNTGGSDGAGLCVFTSIDHAARYQNEPALIGFRDWMKNHPGGSWPEKTDDMIAKMCAEKGVKVPGYIQHTGGDAAFLELALRTGRYPCITYAGNDNVFYRQKIAHMINLVYLDADTAAVHDNNYPGKWLWMTRDQFLSRWRDMSGGWAVVLLKPAPPPLPTGPQMFGEVPVDVKLVEGADFGVDLAKINGTSTYSKSGVPIGRDAAFAALEEGLTDDSADKHLTVVGDQAFRDRVAADVGGLPDATHLRFQSYPPDHWRVKQSKLKPGVTIHAASDSGHAAILWTVSADAYTAKKLAAAVSGEPDAPDAPKPHRQWWMYLGFAVLLAFRDRLVNGVLDIIFRKRPALTADELRTMLAELEKRK